MDASLQQETTNGAQYRQDVSYILRPNELSITRCNVTQADLAIILQKWADQFGVALQSAEFATQMDSADPLRELRKNFTFPTMKDLPCGNKLLKKITLILKAFNRLRFLATFFPSGCFAHK